MTDWYRIELSYAVFAIVVENGIVRVAAPIGRWTVGKSLAVVADWVLSKGGRVTVF